MSSLDSLSTKLQSMSCLLIQYQSMHPTVNCWFKLHCVSLGPSPCYGPQILLFHCGGLLLRSGGLLLHRVGLLLQSGGPVCSTLVGSCPVCSTLVGPCSVGNVLAFGSASVPGLSTSTFPGFYVLVLPSLFTGDLIIAFVFLDCLLDSVCPC